MVDIEYSIELNGNEIKTHSCTRPGPLSAICYAHTVTGLAECEFRAGNRHAQKIPQNPFLI